jgi:hypothetical protein
MIWRSDAIAPVAEEVAFLLAGERGMTRAIAVLDLAERIEITPYAMIARADRHLSPTARLFYAEISRLIESGRGFAPRSAPREPVPGAALQGI